MAEYSGFWDTNNTGDGPSGGFTEERLRALFQMLGLSTAATQGVMKTYLNALAVTGTSSPVSVNTGGAIVYGFWYVNDTSTTVAVPTPSSATRIDRIVLRASWASQTVRLVRVAGTEGGGAPSLTQTANTTWDIPLAQVSITTGGVITVTDQRVYATGNFEAATANIADNAITDAKLRDSAAMSVIGRSANSTGDPADIAAGTDGHVLRRSGTAVGFGQIVAAGITDGTITAAKLASGAVLRTTTIPMLSTAPNSAAATVTGSTPVTFDGTAIHINKDKLPTGATVTLYVVMDSSSGSSNARVNVTGLGSSISDLVTANTSPTTLNTGNIFSNLASGTNQLKLYAYAGGGGSFQVRVYAAYLLIEW